MAENFIVRNKALKDSRHTWWVSCIIDGKVFVTVRRSEAKVFSGDDLEAWQGRENYEVVELPQDDDLMARMNQPQLPGFEDAL